MTAMPVYSIAETYARLGAADQAVISRMIALMPIDKNGAANIDENLLWNLLPEGEATEEELELIRQGEEDFAKGDFVTYTSEELLAMIEK